MSNVDGVIIGESRSGQGRQATRARARITAAVIAVAAAIPTAVVPAVAVGAAAAPRAPAASAAVTEFPLPTGGSAPTSIARGPDGNLWFTESGGNRIGRITTAGAITEFPLATAGSRPQTIASGPDGNLWFTEVGNNAIGRITPAGAITEFAVPTAGSAPWGITSGPDGRMWFTEQNSGIVGRITTAGVITEFPGACVLGPITRGPDRNLWFIDYCGYIGHITTGGTMTLRILSCCFNDIVAGPDGNMWMAGSDHNSGDTGAAFRMATDFTNLTEFPLPTPTSTVPQNIAVGPNGALFMTGSDSQIVESSTAGAMTNFPLPSSGVNPTGITTGPDKNMWFTETSGNAIGRLVIPPSCSTFTATTSHSSVGPGMSETVTLTVQNCGASAHLKNVTTSTTTASPAGCPPAPAVTELTAPSIAPGQSESQAFTFAAPACLGTYTVTSQASLGAKVVGSGTATYAVAIGAEIAYPVPGTAYNATGRPEYITTGSDGNLWYTAGVGGGYDMVRLTPAGVSTTYTTPRGSPQAITTGPDGNLWVADGRSTAIASFTTSGALVLELPLPSGFTVQRITSGPDGNLWFTESTPSGAGIARITTAGKIKQYTLSSAVQGVGGITAGSDGNLWFTAGGYIGRITTAGTSTLFALPSGSARDIALGADGNLWYTNPQNSTIGRVTPAGVITEFATPTANSGPAAITPGAKGNIWFTEVSVPTVPNQSQVGRISPSGAITEFPIADLAASNAQFGITSGPDGNLWAAAYYGFVIGQIGIGPSSACRPVNVTVNPVTVAGGSTEAVTTSVQNCAPTPLLLKLATTTTPPAGCAAATTSKVTLPMEARVPTAVTTTSTAPTCTGTYTVRSRLSLGNQVLGQSTATYQVT